MAEQKTEMTALDRAWGEINALGGSASNETEEAINDTVGKALAILENHGARDPLAVSSSVARDDVQSELLEALKDLASESTETFAHWPDLKRQVEAVIAKAEGKS